MNDLRDDLANLSGQPPPDHLVAELASRLNDALAGTTLTDEAAMRLADRLFVAATARDLSERQQANLRTEVTGALTAAGVPQAKAEPVAVVVGEIQTAIGENRKRWWHWG
jgi:pyrroline-5-carboxylate reductase